MSLTDIFKPRAPALFGMDITNSAIKLVELSGNAKTGIKLERYVIEPLPRDVVIEGKVEKPELLTEAVGKAAKRLGSRARHVAAALPASAVVTKKLIVSAALRPDELDTQVNSDAQQYVPFDMSEVNYDYVVVGRAPSGPDENEVFFAAARKDAVEDRVVAIEQAGFKPRIMDSEQFAMQRAAMGALMRNGEVLAERNLALIDIGNNNTAITVFRDGDQVFSREQAFGGGSLTSDIIQVFNLQPEEAEKVKFGKIPAPEEYQDRVLGPFMESAAEEISRALQMFMTSTAYTTVEAVYLCGGTAALPGLAEYIAGKIELPVEVLNPFHGMTVASSIKADELARDASSLVCACGLALRRIVQ